MADINFIYFDLGNVIMNFDHRRGCEQVASLSGISADEVEQAVFDSGLEERYETGMISTDQFYHEFCLLTNSQPSQPEFVLAASDIFEPNRAIFPLLAQLRAVNFPMGILSNTCEAHWSFTRRRYAVMNTFFSPTVLSYEVNSMKPNRKIYDRALEHAGCHVKKCFFVDDRQENVDGAIEAGIDAVLYRSVPELVSELEQRGVGFNL